MKSTDELMKSLLGKNDLQQYLRENEAELTTIPLCALLNELLAASGRTRAEVVAASGLERSYAYHLFSGARANPSRDVLLSLGLSMGLPVEELQRLLRTAGQAMLYPRVRRDCVLLRAAADGLSVMECNELLVSCGEAPLQK